MRKNRSEGPTQEINNLSNTHASSDDTAPIASTSHSSAFEFSSLDASTDPYAAASGLLTPTPATPGDNSTGNAFSSALSWNDRSGYSWCTDGATALSFNPPNYSLPPSCNLSWSGYHPDFIYPYTDPNGLLTATPTVPMPEDNSITDDFVEASPEPVTSSFESPVSQKQGRRKRRTKNEPRLKKFYLIVDGPPEHDLWSYSWLAPPVFSTRLLPSKLDASTTKKWWTDHRQCEVNLDNVNKEAETYELIPPRLITRRSKIKTRLEHLSAVLRLYKLYQKFQHQTQHVREYALSLGITLATESSSSASRTYDVDRDRSDRLQKEWSRTSARTEENQAAAHEYVQRTINLLKNYLERLATALKAIVSASEKLTKKLCPSPTQALETLQATCGSVLKDLRSGDKNKLMATGEQAQKIASGLPNKPLSENPEAESPFQANWERVIKLSEAFASGPKKCDEATTSKQAEPAAASPSSLSKRLPSFGIFLAQHQIKTQRVVTGSMANRLNRL